MAIKADAYGHGVIETGKYVQKNKLADILGVASIEEGIELRKAGIDLPILVLGLIFPEKAGIDALIDNRLIQSIADLDLARAINTRSHKKNYKTKIHIKVDTGMGRMGCVPGKTLQLVMAINKMKNIILEGIFSHMPVSDNNSDNFNQRQLEIFNSICKELEENNINVPIKHIANSAAIINYPDSYFNTVRPGLMAYGYLPCNMQKSSIKLIPAMSFFSKIIFVKQVAAGTGISYGLTYKTSRACNIATIPVGYGDGYSRFLSNKGEVIINNKHYPICGRICMDQLMVNLGDDYYAPGEKVTLFGEQDITVNTIADIIGTIPYEITCNISKRVPRIYKY